MQLRACQSLYPTDLPQRGGDESLPDLEVGGVVDVVSVRSAIPSL
jgi:hypothetical protein